MIGDEITRVKMMVVGMMAITTNVTFLAQRDR